MLIKCADQNWQATVLKNIQAKLNADAKIKAESRAKAEVEAEAEERMSFLKRRTNQRRNTFRGAARFTTTKEHFDELTRHLNPKKSYLRALAKLNHMMPDAKKHPTLNRMARVAASGTKDALNAAKNHPVIAAAIGGGAAVLGAAGITAKHFSNKKNETVIV